MADLIPKLIGLTVYGDGFYDDFGGTLFKPPSNDCDHAEMLFFCYIADPNHNKTHFKNTTIYHTDASVIAAVLTFLIHQYRPYGIIPSAVWHSSFKP